MQRIYPILLAMAVLLGLALAQQTPAGTNISNQASASYIDSAGQPRTTTSNQVITVVQQVYNFSITPNGPTAASPGQTRTALAGAPVYFSYTVANTGNGTDTINLTLAQDTGDNFDLTLTGNYIYLDANCNGALDSGEAPIPNNNNTFPVTLTRSGTPGSSACVIVDGTIPTSAANGDVGNINLEGTSAGNTSVTDNDNWARATATTAAALTATKSATPSGAVAPGDTITYTISGSNIGGSSASGTTTITVNGVTGTGILISDIIPYYLTVNTSTINGTAGAGTRYLVYTTNGTDWYRLDDPNAPSSFTGNGTVAIGMFIVGSGDFFPQTASYTFSFQATVPANAPAGTSYPNSATVSYNDGTTDQTTTSNTTNNTAGASYNVAVGPYGYPEGGAPSDSYTVSVSGHTYTVTRSSDTQTITDVDNQNSGNVPSGSTVIFRHTLKNKGNTPDRFTLDFKDSNGNTTVPTGWTCWFVADDLNTPISNNLVGSVAANADYNFAVKCQVPAGATPTSVPFDLTVRATSVNDPNKTDSTIDQITVTPGYSVDAAHNVNTGPGNEGSDPANDTRPGYNPAVNPGGVAYFPFEVSNTGANPDTYNLTASLPTGWTAVFYPDTDCNGVMDTPSPAPVSNTGLVNAGATACFIAAVQVPAGAAPADVTAGSDDNVQFTVTSTTLPSVSDTIYGAVDVNLVAQVSLTPDRSGTVTSPGTIQYTHTLTNNSNSGATCSISGSGGRFGWTYQYSLDGSTWAPSLSGVSVAANGGSQTLYVRVITPAGEPIGRTDVNTLTASCNVGGTQVSSSATETTTIVGGDLRLTKSGKTYDPTGAERSSNAAIALPGDQIVYTVVAENIGTGNLKQVIITDPLPSYTSFVSVSASISGFTGTVLYSTDGSTWSQAAPTALNPGQSIYVAVDTNSNNTIDDGDVMPPAATITITFRVQVQ